MVTRGGGLFADGVRDVGGGFGGLVVFLEEVVRQGGVEEAVDVDVLIDEEIIAFVVFASTRVNELCSLSGR